MKKIFIFSIMCLFAVFANAKYTTIEHDWVEKFNFESLLYSFGGDSDTKLRSAPGSEILLTYKEDEDVCIVSIRVNGVDLLDGSQAIKFYNCEFRITDGAVGLYDKNLKRGLFILLTEEECFSTYNLEKFVKSE